jgi:hypothetical protein
VNRKPLGAFMKIIKNILPLICFFFIYLITFIILANTRKRNIQPSEIEINNAIYWANSLLGRPSFPIIGTDNYSWSAYKCADFVANAYGYPASPYHAALLWSVSVIQHPDDWNAPRGSLVFFGPNNNNNGRGHVAISIGNGNLIWAGGEIIISSSIIDESHSASYLGWAWPPSAWPGRKDDIIATTFTLVLQAGKTLVLTLITWLVLRLLNITHSYAKNKKIFLHK